MGKSEALNSSHRYGEASAHQDSYSDAAQGTTCCYTPESQAPTGLPLQHSLGGKIEALDTSHQYGGSSGHRESYPYTMHATSCCMPGNQASIEVTPRNSLALEQQPTQPAAVSPNFQYQYDHEYYQHRPISSEEWERDQYAHMADRADIGT